VPNRIARDSARKSVTLAQLSDFGERGFWRLILAADDFGRFIADPAIVLADCFPRMTDRVTHSMCQQMLCECVAAGLIVIYEVDGVQYGQFVKADKYFQRRAKTSKYPSATQTHSRRAAYALGDRGSGIEDRGSGIGGLSPDAPTAQELTTTSPETVKELIRSTAATLGAPGQQWRR
jgi:hypothetical protein